MSKQLELLISELQGNMETVGEYFDTPELVLDKFGITGEEREAILIRNLDELDDYALSIQNGLQFPSGAHSSTCHIVTLDLESA